MRDSKDDPSRFHAPQPARDLEANWDVDLARKLEDYLLKICSGEISAAADGEDGDGDGDGKEHSSRVNFAEAALLLQGSVQVYSRKVEYLYNLVLHALDFLSEKRQQEQLESALTQSGKSGSTVASDEENQFWVSDDVPVDTRNCLDTSTSKDASFYHFIKPPANLVVLEGDCLDITGDGGELESYLLATNNLYRDFILLDPCDAVAVNNFLNEDETGKGQNGTSTASSIRKSFLSPTRRSGGTGRKSNLGKNRDDNLNGSPIADCGFGVSNSKTVSDPPAYDNLEENNLGCDMDDRYSEPDNLESSDEDEDDPWKPLNPHELGNLKVKPFKKVKAFRRNGINSSKQTSITTLFPLAKMNGTISPELTEMWETHHSRCERHGKSQSPPLYEKLRQSLVNGGHSAFDAFSNDEDVNEDNRFDGDIPDLGHLDDEVADMCMEEDLSFHHEKHDDGGTDFDTNGSFGHGKSSSQASLEDLCRSHLDALLASIAEAEKQTELAARVSSWKQKIEHNLEEQDLHPPFDICAYGERILDKLSVEANDESAMSFTDIVRGQEKHDVARTFSALLQLVNNGDVNLDRSGVDSGSMCYTAINPFCIQLLRHERRQDQMHFRLSKKRVKSPVRKLLNKNDRNKVMRERSPNVDASSQFESTVVSSQPNKFSVKRGKIGLRCTPESKRRRKSRFAEPLKSLG